MMTIASKADEHGLTLGVKGKLSGAALGELRREIERARRARRRVVIDLSEVTLVDRHSLEFLAAQSRDEVRVVNCPEYIEPWMARAAVSQFSSSR
jgi:anti-anti-sigma regulatory factor